MSTPTQRRKTPIGQENIGDETQSSQEPTTVTPPLITVPDQLRDEVAAVVQELVSKAHELSFEYCTLECKDIATCPLAKKGRELFKVVKTFNELMKKLMQTRQAF